MWSLSKRFSWLSSLLMSGWLHSQIRSKVACSNPGLISKNDQRKRRELLLKEIIQKIVQELSQNFPAKLSFVFKCSESHYISISETNTGQENGMGLFFNQSTWKCGHLLLWHMRCILPTSYLNRFSAFLVIRRGNGGCIRIHLLGKQPITSTSTCSCYQRLTWWKSIQIEIKFWCLLFICCFHSKLQGVSLGNLPSFCDIAHVCMSVCWRQAFPFWPYGKEKMDWKLLSFPWQVN